MLQRLPNLFLSVGRMRHLNAVDHVSTLKCSVLDTRHISNTVKPLAISERTETPLIPDKGSEHQLKPSAESSHIWCVK